jgi:hypothetical protein
MELLKLPGSLCSGNKDGGASQEVAGSHGTVACRASQPNSTSMVLSVVDACKPWHTPSGHPSTGIDAPVLLLVFAVLQEWAVGPWAPTRRQPATPCHRNQVMRHQAATTAARPHHSRYSIAVSVHDFGAARHSVFQGRHLRLQPTDLRQNVLLRPTATTMPTARQAVR